MSVWIDSKYIGLISARLEKFKLKDHNPYTANFRCPFCGDSKKNKHKARGYVFTKNVNIFYKCHNCGVSCSCGNLVKQVDPVLYKQYVLDSYKETNKNNRRRIPTQPKFKQPVFKKKSLLDNICSPVENTLAEKYLLSRKIPKEKWKQLYFVDNISKLEQLSEKYKDRLIGEEPRLVIPFYNKDNKLIGVTCRGLANERLRYVTIRLCDDEPMIYNLNNIDFNKTIYVTEGPIDSMFLDNSVAVGNSDLKNIERLLPKENTVLIFDNQPRNKELVNLMSNSVKQNYTMVIWPNDIEKKDINDMILDDLAVKNIISNNTFSGLELNLQFTTWKKI